MEKEKRKKKVLVKEKVLEMPPVMEELSTVGKSTIRVDAMIRCAGNCNTAVISTIQGLSTERFFGVLIPMPTSKRSIRKRQRL